MGQIGCLKTVSRQQAIEYKCDDGITGIEEKKLPPVKRSGSCFVV